jgi:hypothetical protein
MKRIYLAALVLWSATNATASGVQLTAPQPRKDAWYGYSVSANGNTLAVISYDDPVAGVVYVYQPTTKNWNTAKLVAQLTASDGTPFTSVAVYGNVVLAGAFYEQNSQGAVYGFIEPQGGWKNSTESFTLTASDGAAGDIFGSSVAFSNKTIVVGAPGHKIGGLTSGAAYVFTEPVSGWTSATQTAELTSGGPGEAFGQSLAVNGPVVVVGVPEPNSNGALFVYQENVGGWQDGTETARLTDPGSGCQQLGQAVVIVGNTVVGSFTQECQDGEAQVPVVVYNRPGNAWTSMSVPTAKLTAKENLAGHNGFGASLALTNKFLLVGDPQFGWPKNVDGGIFLYAAPQGGWENVVNGTENEVIKPGTGGKNSLFGTSAAALSTGALFVGAPLFVVDGNSGAGAVLIKIY